MFRSSFWLNTNLTLLRYFVKIEKYILLKVITGSCLSLRCLIFKVLAVASELSLSRSDLFILSHFQAFVKRFFKLFSKFFRTSLQTIPKRSFFAFIPSVNFFSASRFSVKSFSSEIRCSCRFSAFFCSLVRQLCYHTTFFFFCQHLFSDFFPFITNCIIYFIFSLFFPFFTLQFVDFVTKSTILTKISFSIAII